MEENKEEIVVSDTETKESTSDQKKLTKQKVISEIANWAIIIGVALILATLINKFIIILQVPRQ